MFDGLTRLALRWPKLVLLIAVLAVGGALVYGLDVLSGLKTGGQTDPSSESAKASSVLETEFAASRPNLVLVARTGGGSVDDPAVAAEGLALSKKLAADPDVLGVTSYWQLKAPTLRSKDGREAVIAARLAGDETQAEDEYDRLVPVFQGQQGPLEVRLGGESAIRSGLTNTIRGDIAKAEAIGIPLVALVLILILRGFFAALLPLLVGAFAVIGTNAALRLISQFTDVSIFSLNLATGLSLGLAADYGLFIVKRFREERRRGHDVETALRITMNTAGRTVAFSSLTVAVSVSSMLVFPLYFLRSFAFAGVSVVLLASLCALVVLPAGMVVMGKLIDVWDFTNAFVRLGRKLRPNRSGQPRVSGWRRWALLVMRRPVWFAVGGIAVLLTLGTPVLRINIGLPDDRTLPVTAVPHLAQQDLRDNFGSLATGDVDVLVPGVQASQRAADLSDYAKRLSEVDGVVSVDSAVGRAVHGQLTPPTPLDRRFAGKDATYLAVSTNIETISSDGQNLVKRIRTVPAPFTAQVGGASADLLDARTALLGKLPLALAIIAATTLILLFLLSGSVLIPFKALAMNVLSLSATFGVLVWIFQDYHFGGFMAFQQTGWVDVTLLVLLFCVAFGVSMDYEVFLLSRIKEEYARTPDNRTAVAYGIEKTGGIVTAAALITSIVFTAMSTARVTNIKMFGTGLALAMIMDAALVRTLLVPALMRLAGRANWWAPKPLRAVYNRIGLKESDLDIPVAQPAAEPEPEPAPAVLRN